MRCNAHTQVSTHEHNIKTNTSKKKAREKRKRKKQQSRTKEELMAEWVEGLQPKLETLPEFESHGEMQTLKPMPVIFIS